MHMVLHMEQSLHLPLPSPPRTDILRHPQKYLHLLPHRGAAREVRGQQHTHQAKKLSLRVCVWGGGGSGPCVHVCVSACACACVCMQASHAHACRRVYVCACVSVRVWWRDGGPRKLYCKDLLGPPHTPALLGPPVCLGYLYAECV